MSDIVEVMVDAIFAASCSNASVRDDPHRCSNIHNCRCLINANAGARAAIAALEAAGWVVVKRTDSSDDFVTGPVPDSSFPVGGQPTEEWHVVPTGVSCETQPERTPGIVHRQEPYEEEKE